MMEEIHYKRVDEEPKPAKKRGLIKTHFTMCEEASFFILTSQTNPGLIWKMEPIPKTKKGFLVQIALLLEGMKGPSFGRG